MRRRLVDRREGRGSLAGIEGPGEGRILTRAPGGASRNET
jgi:hypothetical protein